MVDIQSTTAEIRRENKKEDRQKIEETTGQNIMSASAAKGGHNKIQSVSIHEKQIKMCSVEGQIN